MRGVTEMAVDPVCGMQVNPATAAGKTEYQGRTYYFCGVACQRDFEEDPEKFLSGSDDDDDDDDDDSEDEDEDDEDW
jgi:YHS domain-containing protein